MPVNKFVETKVDVKEENFYFLESFSFTRGRNENISP
jgi:hypothetical protein